MNDMEISRLKRGTFEKQLINNLPSSLYLSTMSFAEIRRVSLADWITLFTHLYV